MPITADFPGVAPGSNLTQQEWNDSIFPALYERQWFIPRCTKLKRGYNQLNVPKMGIVSGQVLSGSTQDGTTMNLDSMNPSSTPITPNWLFAGHAYPDSLIWRSVDGIPEAAANNAENSLAAFIESQALVDVGTGTNTIGGPGVDMDVAIVRAVVATLRNNALLEADPGSTDIYALAFALQHDDLMSVPEFTSAEQLGNGSSPLVQGMFGKGNGVTFQLSTLQLNDANGRHNPFWVRSAFGYYYNSPPRGERQRLLAQNRVFAQTDFAHGVLFNSRFVDVRSKAA